MTKTIGFVALAAVLAGLAMAWSASAQQAPPTAGMAGVSSRWLVTNFQTAATGPTTLTVVEPQTKIVAVYHIIRETGEIQLKSVRNINGDLTLEAFNTGSPSPADIRKMTERGP